MRELIARICEWMLPVLAPRRPGRHSAAYLTAQPSLSRLESPWSRPWNGPSAAQAREIFRPVDTTMQLRPCSPEELERRYAAGFAAIGVDYWHSAAGPDFSRRTAGVAA
ncbi:hypothetical protein [Streptomyces erythrochromogenes]|uniref:hypothetical protein n=1 Tax=Streptomyces erythrochromogenes TaxID=285574 RepID=UPI0038250E8C